MLFRHHLTFLRDKTNGNSHDYSTGREPQFWSKTSSITSATSHTQKETTTLPTNYRHTLNILSFLQTLTNQTETKKKEDGRNTPQQISINYTLEFGSPGEIRTLVSGSKARYACPLHHRASCAWYF